MRSRRISGLEISSGLGNGGKIQMGAFFPELLDCFTDSSFIEKVGKKYHYGKLQVAELHAVAGKMLPLIRQEACWERRAAHRLGGQPFGRHGRNRKRGADMAYEEVVATLGRGLDDLQEDYTKKGRLSECYMLEALASELLLEAYGAYNRYIRENTAFHVARYHFYGSEEEFPLEMLPQVMEKFTIQVSCNEAYCMLPKKSVAFVAELTRDESVRCQGICMGCGSVQCPNRIADALHGEQEIANMTDLPLNYGYSRIFGKRVLF